MSTSVEALALPERDAAKALNISPRTLFSIRQRGEIGFVKVGTRILYPVDALRDYLKRNQQVALASIPERDQT